MTNSLGNNSIWRRIAFALAPVAALAGIIGCNNSVADSSGEPAGDGKLQVVATTGPVGDMVRNIAGDLGTVDVMMGPGVDPHLYKELPSDMQKIAAADIVFYNGLHLEGRMAEVLERRGQRHPVYAVTERLEKAKDERLRFPREFDGFADPHVWHDAALWADCAEVVGDRLAEIDPENAATYREATKAYQDKLLELDAYCRAEIESLPEKHRLLVTAHDAFGYFSKAYGLESVGMKGISTEDEVSLGRMDEVVQLIIDRQLPAIFAESSSSDRLIEAVIEPCRQAGHDVKIGEELYADALGKPEDGADTYEGMMRSNVDAIVRGLGGK
ncbi:MAG: zinc ABC transporter substrate-binding protein [Planctomycetota bacterium]